MSIYNAIPYKVRYIKRCLSMDYTLLSRIYVYLDNSKLSLYSLLNKIIDFIFIILLLDFLLLILLDSMLEFIPRLIGTQQCTENRNERRLSFTGDPLSFRTCDCEDHCSWDMCNLQHPPPGCLRTYDSIWHWDYRRKTWVAQVVLGIITLQSK